MCLGEVVQLVALEASGAALARAGSRTIPLSLITMDVPVAVGDWVLAHSGFALSRLEPEEAGEAITLRRAGQLVPREPMEGSA